MSTTTTRKPAAKPATKPAESKVVVKETTGDKTVTIKKCACGCGGNVPSKSLYKMGHDAKHAGMVGREAGSAKVNGDKDWKKILNQLPTANLQTKAIGIATNHADRLLAKLEREEAKAKAEADKKAKAAKAEAAKAKSTTK